MSGSNKTISNSGAWDDGTPNGWYGAITELSPPQLFPYGYQSTCMGSNAPFPTFRLEENEPAKYI